MDEIVIVEYDPAWPILFEAEAERLRQVLSPELIVTIEHYGSTAVPGLAAKPIIDLLIAVRSLETARREAVSTLERLGYSFWVDNPDSAHMFFVKGLPPKGPRTHHIHMVEPDSPLWEHLLFRDYLRKHPEEAERYAQLKCELSARFQEDREAYTEGKSEYVKSIIEKAQQEILVLDRERYAPDAYFTQAQYDRMQELLARRALLTDEENTELDVLIDAELDATVIRTDPLLQHAPS